MLKKQNRYYPYKFIFILRLRLFKTTDKELNAMATPANIGCKEMPKMGINNPAARGIPIRL